MADDPLLQPFQLKHLTLRNRIILTAHEPAYAENGLPGARYRAYHVERAKAGVALTMTAGSATVSRDSPPAFNNILAYKDEVVAPLRDLVDACHEQGAAVMIQITHLGRRTHWARGDWLPVVSASARREPAHRAFPKIIEDWDCERIIQDYADAAERMQAAGMDGIELEAYGHLLDQFWSPYTNTLDEPYGGSLDNRLRFTFEVLKAIRARVGSEFIVGVRNVADECLAGGLTKAEGVSIAKRLADSGKVDFLNIIRGHIDTDAALTDVIPVMGMPSAPHLSFAGEVRTQVKLPILHAAKIADIATARYAIAEGLVDLVGMTRAHLADPHIVRKLKAGQEHTIRPCVGATYCLDRIYQGGEAYCIHNAASGRETELPHQLAPAAQKKHIVIVGAGPAGLEAARVAGECGHKVTVLEADSEAGGQLRLAVRSPRRRDLQGIIDWRLSECERYGVQFQFNQWAESDQIVAIEPDVVIVATGGLANTEGFSPHNDLVLSTWDALAGGIQWGQRVLLYDDAGDHAALQAAEVIAQSGAQLEVMTPDRSFAADVMGMNLVPYMRQLQPLGVTFTVTYRLLQVERTAQGLKALIGSDYGPWQREAYYDQIVVNHGTTPLDSLYFDLKPLSINQGAVDYSQLLTAESQQIVKNPQARFSLYRIGDAVAARNVHAAIYDAVRLVRTL